MRGKRQGGAFDGGEPLARLTEQLRENERVWAGFRQVEIGMIGAESFPELIDTVCHDLPAIFAAVDCVSLACLDPEYELKRLVVNGDGRAKDAFVVVDEATLHRLMPAHAKPLLGRCTPELQRLLFPAFAPTLGSFVAAPLRVRGRLIGCLNQGSRDANHYTPQAATDLLEHLAAVAAMCIENAINRERLKLDGLTDPLTGIANRRLFERRLQEEWNVAVRTELPLACLVVDVDHFKQINDRFGHQAGDTVLSEIAKTLAAGVKKSDVLARYGGEEFVLLLPGTSDKQAALAGERLRDSIQNLAFNFGGEPLRVTVSLGLGCLPTGVDRRQLSARWLLQQADDALYRAKAAGRNRVVVAAPDR